MPPYRHSQRGWLTGDSLAPETGRVLIIPGDLAFVMAVNGALLELTQAWNWEQYGTVTAEEAADAMRIMYFDWIESEIPVIYNFPTIDLFAFMNTNSGGTWTYTAQSTMPFGFYMQGPTTLPSASGHRIRSVFRAPAGDYAYTGVYFTTALSGIATIDLTRSNGATVVTNILSGVDLYGGSVRTVVTGTFTIPSDGEYEIQVKTGTTKNALSGGYGSAWTSHHLRRTA